MKAIVLAAGEGKRMRPLTATRPKVLLPAGPEPLLHRLLRQLGAAGVRDVTLVVHHGAHHVRESVGDGSRWDLDVAYAPQGEARGTGHAVTMGKPPADAPFLVLNGDVFLPDDALRRVVDAGPGTVTGARVADPRRYGVFEQKGGGVVGVVEKSDKPPSDLVNAGVYHAPRGFDKILARLPPSPRGEIEITDALDASFREAGPWRLVEVDDWLDVGFPWDLLAASERALRTMEPGVAGRVEPGATLHGAVRVEEGAVVKAGAYVEGPVHIGRDCVVGPNCHLRANTVLLDGCKVGNASEVKASLLMEGAHVGHLSYVGDSVLGRRVNLGAGTKVANLRHDGRNVHVVQEGVTRDTGRRKFGVVLGDDVHTGINTSLNVGVMLPAGEGTFPGEVVLKSRV